MSDLFVDPVPPDVARRLAGVRDRDDRVLLRISFDLDEHMRFGAHWLELTESHLNAASDHEAGPVLHIPLDAVESTRFEPVVGGGRLVIDRTGGAPMQFHCSNSETSRVSEAARAIENVRVGRSPGLPTRLETKRCPRCHRLLSEVDGPCQNCVQAFGVLRRVSDYLRPQWAIAAALIVTTVAGTAAELVPPLIIQRIVDDILIPGRDWTVLGRFVIVLIALRLVMWVLEVGRGSLGASLGTRTTAALRRDVYRRLQAASLLHLDRRPVGVTMARITSDVDRIEEFVVSALPLLVMNVLLLVGIVGFLLMTSWRLTLYVLAPMPVIAVAAKLSWSPVRRAWARQADRWARLSDRVSQSLGGIREIRAFGQELREIDSFEARHDDLVRVSIRGERLSFAFFAVLYLLMGLGQIAMWYFGGRDVLAGTLTLGTLLAIIAYLWMLYWPLQWLGQLHQAAIQALTGAERVFEVLDTPLESGTDAGTTRLPQMRGAVRFEDVTFGYDPARPVVQHVTLDVHPGERIAIVGRSGAGKTTLINLLCRFYQPDAGRILVDGVDLRNLRVTDLRAQLAVVLQEPFLFSGSIAGNIRYGRPEARFEEVVAAARAAGAHEFIVARDDGYDSEVGERGDRLSGGERQRIAIARALLRDPRILILDEATSSVDAPSEAVIRDAIARLAAGRTTFIIAHKLSSVRHADRFVVLERGRVVEAGRYDDLLQQRGAFYDLVMSVETAPVASS